METEQRIREALPGLEREHGVVILLAAESGSRAWGFPSPDSDWDVRFLYAHPTRWHLALEPGRDVIEATLPGDLDLAGWELRKALNLILKGNQAVREWLCSPIVYAERGAEAAALRDLVAAVPGRAAALGHYRSLIVNVWETWLGRAAFPLKKYLYAIRPALCIRWMAEREGLPPMDLPALLREATLGPAERAAIGDLLRAKAVSSEMGTGARIPVLHALIEGELARAAAMLPTEVPVPAAPALRERAFAIMLAATALADAEHPPDA